MNFYSEQKEQESEGPMIGPRITTKASASRPRVRKNPKFIMQEIYEEKKLHLQFQSRAMNVYEEK